MKWSVSLGQSSLCIILFELIFSQVPDCVYDRFEVEYHEEYDVEVPFTRETWHGRMKACRGVGASLSPNEIERWEIEHKKLLMNIAPREFSIKHYVAMLELKRK